MNKNSILKILFVVSCLSILSCSLIGCEDKDLLDPTKSQQDNEIDILRKYQLKNESDLDKIREYNLENYQEYNGDTNFWKDRNIETSLAESKEKGTYESSTGLFSRTATNSIVEKSNADRLYEDQNQLVSWLYYDAEEDDWGDAYYYVLKTDDGRENYEYAYSVIKGKKKVYDRLNGSRGQVIIVPEDYKVPADIQEQADKEFITIIHMPDSEFENDYKDEDLMVGQTFEDPYAKYEYYNDPDVKEEYKQKHEEIRNYFLSLPVTKVDLSLDSGYVSNAKRRIEDLEENNSNNSSSNGQNSNNSSNNSNFEGGNNNEISNKNNVDISGQTHKDKVILYTAELLNQYNTSTNDLMKLAANEQEKEEVEYLDKSTVLLSVDNIELFSNVGFKSELVVVRLNNSYNKIMKRAEAHSLIEDMYKEKLKLVENANSLDELKISNSLSISCPSAREFDINDKISKLELDFSEQYRHKAEVLRKR